MYLKLAGGKKPTHLTTSPLKNTGNWAKGNEGKNTTYQGAERINARDLIFLILNTINMKTELLNFLQETYDFAKTNNWTLKDIISEITLAGFSNEEIGIMMKHILLNETFLTCLNK